MAGEAAIRCLQFPLSKGSLLVPNAAVVEVLPFANIVPVHDVPPWILGMVRWQQSALPLIALEAIGGAEPPQLGRRNRVAILHALGDKSSGMDFFGVLMQGIPRLQHVTKAELSIDDGHDAADGVAMRITVKGQEAVIADIDRIEALLAEHFGKASG